MIKKLFITAFTAAILTSNTLEAQRKEQIVEQTVNSRTKIEICKGEGAVYLLSRRASEKSLDVLCRDNKVKLEDAWLHQDSALHDIGYEEERENVKISHNTIAEYTNRAVRGDTLFIYHIHSKKTKGKKFFPPSRADIFMYAYAKDFSQSYSVNLSSRVFDGTGMWEIDTSPEFLSAITSEGADQNRGYITRILRTGYKVDVWSKRNRAPRDEIERISRKYNPEEINKYIALMKTIGVNLKYTSSENLQQQSK
jgi:hypothetical protein